MSLLKKYYNAEKHDRREIEKSIAGLCGVLDFRFSCMLEDTELELTVNYEYMKDNERLNKLFKKYFKNEENVEKDDYDNRGLGELFALDLIAKVTDFKYINDIILINECSNLIILGLKKS